MYFILWITDVVILCTLSDINLQLMAVLPIKPSLFSSQICEDSKGAEHKRKSVIKGLLFTSILTFNININVCGAGLKLEGTLWIVSKSLQNLISDLPSGAPCLSYKTSDRMHISCRIRMLSEPPPFSQIICTICQ